MLKKNTFKKSIHKQELSWFKITFRLRSSVIPAIIPRVIFCGLFGLFICIVHSYYRDVGIPILSTVVPSIVLGLLLVFRTNTAYERFWEGRKLWGALVNSIRNLARSILVAVKENNPEDREEKIKILNLLVVFAIVTKLHLRGQAINNEIIDLLPNPWYKKLQEAHNPPLQVAFLIQDYLQKQYDDDCINSYQLTSMLKLLDSMVDVVGGCERILKTPIPVAYSIHLKQLLLIYCLTLPFQLVTELALWTAPIVSVISFTVFGIEQIGIEIENPFGHDANDLPLENICKTIQTNIEELINFALRVKTMSSNE
jgi:ion channel-forming bestrophin family protein